MLVAAGGRRFGGELDRRRSRGVSFGRSSSTRGAWPLRRADREMNIAHEFVADKGGPARPRPARRAEIVHARGYVRSVPHDDPSARRPPGRGAAGPTTLPRRAPSSPNRASDRRREPPGGAWMIPATESCKREHPDFRPRASKLSRRRRPAGAAANSRKTPATDHRPRRRSRRRSTRVGDHAGGR